MKKQFMICCLLLSIVLAGCGRQENNSKDAQISNTGTEAVTDVNAFLNPDDNMKSIPDNYKQTISNSGNVERFEYTTDEGNKKHAMVYLPYGYNAAQKYDILYLMHGGGGSAEGVLGNEGGSNELTKILDNLIENGDMRPMIGVAPTFYPEEGADSSVGTAEKYVKLFPEEWKKSLVPALESQYSTYAETTDEKGLIESREHRAFGGFSMGSVTTWYIYMQNLSYVSTFLPISGDCWSEGMQAGGSKPEETATAISNSLKASGYGTDDFYIYAVTGTKDIAEPYMTPMLTAMQQLSDTFIFNADQNKGNIRYRVKNGGVHDMENVKQYLYNILPELWPKNTESKSLVMYFNYSDNVDTTGLDVDAISSASLRVGAKGNTENLKLMADEIAEKKNADVFTIKINEVYPADFEEMAPKARDDISNNTSFTFKGMPENLDEYSVIYVGSPIWWYELPQPMKEFIRKVDLSGKTVVPFGIHRGSGFNGIPDEYKKAWPDATIVEGFTIDADKKNTEVKESFDAFLDKLEY